MAPRYVKTVPHGGFWVSFPAETSQALFRSPRRPAPPGKCPMRRVAVRPVLPWPTAPCSPQSQCTFFLIQ